MSTIKKFISLLGLIFAVGCTNPSTESSSGEEGILSLSFDLSDLRSDTSDDLLKSSVTKIYNSNGDLIRYYTGDPDTISEYIATGKYSATFRAGVEQSATFDATQMSYYGENNSIVVYSQQTTIAPIMATLQNSIVSISFDSETIEDHFSKYNVVVYVANSVEEIDDETPSLTYSSDDDGYFLLSEGVENIVWQFFGDSQVVSQGVIEDVESAHQYKMSFKYTDYLEVNTISLDVQDPDIYDDSFGFEVQPTIESVDFDIDEIQYYTPGDSYTFLVSTISTISHANVVIGDAIFSSLTSDVVNYDYDNNLLTVSSEVFEGSAWGGVQEVDIQAINDGGSMGVTHMSIAVTGFSGLTSEDFWGNTATFNVYTTYSGISEIKVRYRYSGDTSWSSYMTAEQVSSNTWSVQNTSEWSEGTNGSGLTIYNLTRGILPSKDYEVQISIDGVESDIAEVTSSATTQTVTYGNLNDSSMSCFTTSNSGSTSWASGNNSTTSSLCTYFSSGNYAGVYMKTTSAAGVLAAGNLFTGVFSMSGTLNSTGNASFGQAFEWLARPTSLKVTYKAAPRSDDKGRVFIALVDWSSRQTVSVNGLSSTVSGIWDPETTDSVISDNDIIGYGSVLFGETTSDFAEVTVPINYYNKITKPDNTYTIVISCTASYKGDYLEGTEDSELWIDNIEFGY